MPSKNKSPNRNLGGVAVLDPQSSTSGGPASSLLKLYIHTLPDDILLEIFSISVKESTCMKDYRTPFQYILTTVCRHWRDLVMHAPLLWTFICIPSDSLFDTFKYFERSQPAMIDVRIDYFSRAISADSNLYPRASNAIAKHISRLRSLHICFWESQEVYPIFRAWKDLEAANLESLIIILESPSPSFLSPLSLINVPSLLSLQLQGFYFKGSHPLPNLTSLEMDRLDMSPKDFQDLLKSCPLLNTLIIYEFQMPSHLNADTGDVHPQIDAPSLRSLAINIDNYHTEDCRCVLPFLSMKNLEYLEVAYLGATFNDHHDSILSQWKTLPSLKKLRIYSHSIWMNDVSFLSTLPATTNLDIIDFPKLAAESALTYILNLTNLKSIVFDLSSPKNPRRSLNMADFADVFSREEYPKLGCPIVFSLTPESGKFQPAGIPLQALYDDPSLTKGGFLVTYLKSRVFEEDEEEMIYSLWGEGQYSSDQEFIEDDEFDLYVGAR